MSKDKLVSKEKGISKVNNVSTLRECPFCGSKGAKIHEESGLYAIMCDCCCGLVGYVKTIEECTENWNSRWEEK